MEIFFFFLGGDWNQEFNPLRSSRGPFVRQTPFFLLDSKMIRENAALILISHLSGFSGLIYESIWSHYLKLFLRHAGIRPDLGTRHIHAGALGSWLCSKYSVRWANLFLGYAAPKA